MARFTSRFENPFSRLAGQTDRHSNIEMHINGFYCSIVRYRWNYDDKKINLCLNRILIMLAINIMFFYFLINRANEVFDLTWAFGLWSLFGTPLLSISRLRPHTFADFFDILINILGTKVEKRFSKDWFMSIMFFRNF